MNWNGEHGDHHASHPNYVSPQEEQVPKGCQHPGDLQGVRVFIQIMKALTLAGDTAKKFGESSGVECLLCKVCLSQSQNIYSCHLWTDCWDQRPAMSQRGRSGFLVLLCKSLYLTELLTFLICQIEILIFKNIEDVGTKAKGCLRVLGCHTGGLSNCLRSVIFSQEMNLGLTYYLPG